MPEGVKLPIGQLYQANYDEHLAALRAVCKSLCHQYNQLDPGDRAGQMEILRRLLGTVGKEAEVMPPIWFDYGCNVHLGEKFYSNHNLIITDGAEVRFGDNVFVGPNCCFTTAEHPIDPELRVEGWRSPCPSPWAAASGWARAAPCWPASPSATTPSSARAAWSRTTSPPMWWPWACPAGSCGR